MLAGKRWILPLCLFTITAPVLQSAEPGANQPAGARNLQAAHRDQHHGLRRQRDHRRRSHGQASARRRFFRRRRHRRRSQRPQEESRRPFSRHRKAQAHPVHRASGRRRSPSRGLDHRSLRIPRKRRLLLRPRHRRHEGRRRHPDHQLHPDEKGRLRSRPRYHRRA